MARRCCCLPAMSWCRTELVTVGAWLGTRRPPWLLSSSEPADFSGVGYILSKTVPGAALFNLKE